MTELSGNAERVLTSLVERARAALGPTLDAIILFGSAAEGRLRPTSDLNIIFVLTAFERERIDALKDAIRVAHAAVELSPMFLLRDELPAAANAFAAKFHDIVRRHRVLWGNDPFAGLTISKNRLAARLEQVLLNLQLRLRAAYVTRSLFEEQLVKVAADAAGPLRAAAATLLELEGGGTLPPKEALAHVAGSLDGESHAQAVRQLSEARERRILPPGAAPNLVLALIELAGGMHARASRVREAVR